MKKLLFVAALGVGGMVSANSKLFDESKKVDESPKQLCGVVVTFYDSNGWPTSVKSYYSYQHTLTSCQIYQSTIISNLMALGYRITYGPVKPNASIY